MNGNSVYNVFNRLCRYSTQFHIAACAVLLLCFALCGGGLRAQTSGTWTLNGSGNWSTTTNWSGGTVPGLVDPGAGPGDVVNIIANISGTRTITLDVPVWIGVLRLGDTNNTNAYIIGIQGGANVITFKNGGLGAVIDHMTGGSPGISPNGGDRIDADVVLEDALTVNMDRSLELRGTWTGNGNDVTVNFGSTNNGALFNMRRTGSVLGSYSGIGTFSVLGDGEARISDAGNVLGAANLVIGDGTLSTGQRILPAFRFERTDTTQTVDIALNNGYLISTTNAVATPQTFTGTLTVTGTSNLLQIGNVGNDRRSLFTGDLLGAGTITKFDAGRMELQGDGSGFTGELRIARGNTDARFASVLLTGANATLNGSGTIISTERDAQFWIDDSGVANPDRIADDGAFNLRGIGANHRSQIRYIGNAAGSTEAMGELNFQFGTPGFGTTGSAAGINLMLESVSISGNASAQFMVYGANQGFGTTIGGLVANTTTIRLLNDPLAGTAAGNQSNGILVGAFGGSERYNMGLVTPGNEGEYAWVVRDLMKVDTTTVPGSTFLRAMTSSDYDNKAIGAPTHAFTEDMELNTGNVTLTDNVRLVGGFGVDTSTTANLTRWDSVYRVTEGLTMNSLTLAQNFDTGSSNPADITGNDQDGNRVLLDIAPETTVTLTTGMILFGGTGTYNATSGNLNLHQFIRGGTIDSGTADFYLHNSTVWLRTTSNGLSSSNSEAFIDSVLSGSGDLIKSGPGSIYLQAANTYTGQTIIHQGALVLRDPLAIQNSSGVTVDTYGSFYLSGGINVGGGKQITVETLATSQSGLQSIAGHNTWDGDFVSMNVDSMGVASLHSARIAASSETTLTMYGDIYGDATGVTTDTGLSDSQLISTYNSGNGVLNLKGAFKDNAAGAVAGAISSANENTLTRFQVGGAEELNVNVFTEWQSQGRIYHERGYLRIMPTIAGDFWAAGITPSTANSFTGYQMGGSGSTGNSNLALMLTAAGQTFNLDSWAVGGDSTNQSGNSMLGGENTTGTVTFGRGTGTITLSNRTTPTDPSAGGGGSVVQTYNRDLRLYAAPGGTVDIAARIIDGGSNVNSSITKVGQGTVRLLGSTAGASTVERLNVMDGRLVLDYSANNNNRVGANNSLSSVEIVSGGSGYVVGNVITVTGGGGTNFRARVTSVDGGGAITGIVVENEGQNFTADPTTIVVAQGSAASAFAGTGATLLGVRGTPLQMGGGVLELVGNGSAATVQNIAGLGVLSGASEIFLNSQAGQTTTLNLGSVGNGTTSISRVTRNHGGALNFVAGGTGISVINLFGNNLPASGFIASWATVGGQSGQATDWASLNGTAVEAFTSYAADSYLSGNHTNVTLDQTFAANTATGTMRFNDGNARTLDLGGSLLTLELGGLLMTSNQGAVVNISNGSVTSSFLSAPGINDLLLHQYGAGTLNLSAQIVDDAVNSRAVSLVTAGAGVIDLSANVAGNTYSGGTVLNGATLIISDDNQLGAVPGATDADNLWFHGGTLKTNADVVLDAARGITVGGGGAIFDVATATTTTVNGVITREDNVIAGYASNHVWGDVFKTGGGTLELVNGNASNSFAGLLDIQQGTVSVRGNGDEILGTNRSFQDRTIVRSGATLLFNTVSNDQWSREWIELDGGTLKTDLAGGNWQFSTGGNLIVTQDSFIEVATSDALYVNRFGGVLEGNGNLTKIGRGTVYLMENSPDYTGQWTILEGSVWNRSMGDGYGTLDGTPGSKGQAILLGNDGVVTSANNGEVNIGFIVNNGGTNGSYLGTSSQVGSSANSAAVDAYSNDYYINNDIVVRAEGVGSTVEQNKRLRFYSPTYNGQKFVLNGNIILNDDLLMTPNQADSETLSMGEKVHIELNGNLLGNRNLQLYVEQNANVTDPDNSYYALYKLTGDNSAYTGKLIVGGNSDAHVRVYARPMNAAALPSLWDLENNGYIDLRQALPGTGPKTITLTDLGTQAGLTTGRIIVESGDLNLVVNNLTNQSFTSVITDLNITAGPAYDDQDSTTAISAATGKVNLIKDGPGYFLINNAGNNYTGYTQVIGGILRVEHVNAMGTFNALDTSTHTFINVDPITLQPVPGGTGALDLRGLNFAASSGVAEIFHLAGHGPYGAGALINSTGTAIINQLILHGDATVNSQARFDMRQVSGGGAFAQIDMSGVALNKFGAGDHSWIDTTVLNPGTINIYEGEFRAESSSQSAVNPTLLDGMTINIYYNPNPWDGSNPLNGTRTSGDTFNPTIISDTAGNSVLEARLEFYQQNVTHSGLTINMNRGSIDRNGRTTVGEFFTTILDGTSVINLQGGGIRDNFFNVAGGSSAYNSGTSLYDAPGSLLIEGAIDNTSGGNAGSGITKRGNRELRLENANTGFNGTFLVKQNTGRYLTPGFNTTNGAIESQYASLTLSGASGDLVSAAEIRVERFGSVWLDNTAANNNNRINDNGILSLRNGYLLLATNALVDNTENLGNINSDIGTNKLFIDSRPGGRADITLQSLNIAKGSVLKIANLDSTATWGTGLLDDRIALATLGSVTMVGNATGTTDRAVILGAFGSVVPGAGASTVAQRPLSALEAGLARSNAAVRLLTVENIAGIDYIRPLHLSEYDTSATAPAAGSNWMVTSSQGTIGNRDNAVNISSDLTINSLTISDTATDGNDAEYVIVGTGVTLTINSGIINFASYVTSNDASKAAVIGLGGMLSMNGHQAILNSGLHWEDLDRNDANYYAYVTGNSAYIRASIVNADGFVKTGRNSLLFDTWNQFAAGSKGYVTDESSLYIRHSQALGGISEVVITGAGNLLLSGGVNVTDVDIRALVGDSTYALRSENHHQTWAGNLILDNVDSAGSKEFTGVRLSALNNATLTFYGDIYVDPTASANATASDLWDDPFLVTTNSGEAGILNLRGQVRDLPTGPLDRPVNSRGDTATTIDRNHSLRFQMTSHDEMIVNTFQQWNATGRLHLERGYFRIQYDPAAAGLDGTGFLTNTARSLILANDYWSRAALSVDSTTNTGTYHAHLFLTRDQQVFNWPYLYIHNNNGDGTITIGGENRSGTVYYGSAANDVNTSIQFANQGNDRDLRILQVRGGTTVINARFDDEGTTVNSGVSIVGPGIVRINGNAIGSSDIERWNFIGGTGIWSNHLANNRFAASTAQAMFGGGTLILEADAAARTHTMSGNFRLLSGGSAIEAQSNLTLTLGSGTATFSRESGATLVFAESGTGTINLSGTTDLPASAGQRFDSWAVYGTSATNVTDWAAREGTTGVAAFTGYTDDTFAAGTHTRVTTDTALAGNTQTATVKFGASANLDVGAGNMLSVEEGGILIGADIAGDVNISNGSVTSGWTGGNRDLVLHNYGSGKTTISSTIADNGPDRVNLVHSGTGTTELTGQNTYTGDTYVNGGVLTISSDGQLGLVNGSITKLVLLNGGSSLATNQSGVALTFIGGGAGSGVAGTFNTNSSGVVSSVTLTNGGSGYTQGVVVRTDSSDTSETFAGVWAIMDSGNLHLDGGTLNVTQDVTLNAARTIFLGGNGGTFDVNAGSTLTINGFVTSDPSHVNTANGYTTSDHIGGGTQPYTDRNPDMGDFIVEGGGTVVLSGSPDGSGTEQASLGTAVGGITWINNGILRIKYAGSGVLHWLGTHRSFTDGTIIGANGTLELNTASNGDIYEWFTLEGEGYQGGGTIRTIGTAREYDFTGQMFINENSYISNRNNSTIYLGGSTGTFYGNGDITYSGSAGTFRIYTNANDWTGRLLIGGGSSGFRGEGKVQGLTELVLTRNAFFLLENGDAGVNQFDNRLPDDLPVFTNGDIRMRMDGTGGVYSGLEKIGVVTAQKGLLSFEFNLGSDLVGGSPRLTGDYAGWHVSEIVRTPGSSVHLRNLDAGTDFAGIDFNDTVFADKAVMRIDVLPTLIGSGDGFNGNARIVQGFFGGTRPTWTNLAGTGNIFTESYTANRLVTVVTNTAGEHYLRPLLDSEYKVVSHPGLDLVSSIRFEDQGITADQNLKIVGVITDTGIGSGELTARHDSFITLGSVPSCVPAVINSLTFASESFVANNQISGGSRNWGNYTALFINDGHELTINSGMVQVANTGIQNRGGVAANDGFNLDIRSAINGGAVNFNGQEAHFSIGGLWAHYNTADALNAFRNVDTDNTYLWMNSSIVNANGLTKTGSGAMFLQAVNSYTGLTSVNQGALYARHNRALGLSNRVEVTGSGFFAVGHGARIDGVELYVGAISGNNVALSIENGAYWGGNVIIDNIDSSGTAGAYLRNFRVRINGASTNLGTLAGDIYGGPTPIHTGAQRTDARMFSTYTGGAGIFDIRGRVRDTATGAIAGPITEANQTQLLRMELVANNDESNYQLWQQYDAAGRIRLLRGYMRYNGEGNFYTAAAAAAVNSNPLNPMAGFQMGGRAGDTSNGEGAANLAFFLANAGSNFNLKSWEVGVETYDPLNTTGNDNYGRGNTTGNTTLGGEQLSGEVIFGTGEGSITFTQTTRQTSAYNRDLRLYAAEDGEVAMRVSFLDGGSLVNSSITKTGSGTVKLQGSSAGGSTVEAVNLLGGVLTLENYAANLNRRVGSGASLQLGGGILVMDGTGASFTENFGSLSVLQGGNGIVAAGNGVTNFGTLSFAGAAITRSAGGSLHFQSIGGGILNFSNAAMASVARIGSYATFGSNLSLTPFATDWAATDAGGNVIAFSGYAVDSFGAGQHTDVQGAGLVGGATGSMRFNSSTGTVTSGSLTLDDGGVLITSNHTGGTIIGAGVGLTTNAVGVDLLIHNFATGDVTIAGDISGGQNVVFTGAGTTVLTGTNNYTGATHLNGAAVVAVDGLSRFGATSGFVLNGGTLRYTGATTTPALTQNITLGGANGTIEVSDALGRLILRGTAANQIRSEANNIISTYGTNNPNNGGLVILGPGTVQFGNRSAAAATQDLLGVENSYTGLTILGDGTNALRVAIQGQGNDNAYYTPFGTTHSWTDGTLIRNNVTLEFAARRGDGSRDNQIRFREWFQIGEQAGDQILFDGSTQRQPTLDGFLNIIGDLTFQTQGNRQLTDPSYADNGGTGNAEFLINPNEGGVYGSGNIIKLGDGNVRFYQPLHTWTGDLDIRDGFVSIHQNSGVFFNSAGTIYFGDPTGTETSTIQMRIENRYFGNTTTGMDSPNVDLTVNRDIIVRDNLKQEVRIAAGYLPHSSMIHFTNSINVGSGSTAAIPVRFYYEDTSNLNPDLVGHHQHAVFDITGNLSGSNNVFIDGNEGGALNDDFDIYFTVWLRGDNSAFTGRITLGADLNINLDTDDVAILRLGSANAITDNEIRFRNGGLLQVAGLDRTFTQNILFEGGTGVAEASKIENASGIETTITFDSGSQTLTYQDIGVGIRDGVADNVFGGGSAALNVVKTGTGYTVFGASTGGAFADEFSSYTGTTTVQQGILYAGSNNSFSPYSRFIVESGAELSVYWDEAGSGFDNTIGSLSGSGGSVVDVANGILRFGLDNTNDADFAGVISADEADGSISKVGYGTQRLSGVNTFIGDVEVVQGTLIGGNNSAFGDAANEILLGGQDNGGVNVIDGHVELLLEGTASAVANPVSMNSINGNDEGITVIGTRATTGTYGFTSTGTVELYQDYSTNVFVEAAGDATFQFGGAITNGGDIFVTEVTPLVKVGTGTVEFRANNTYGIAGTSGAGIDGGTVVRHGTLAVFADAALSSSVVELGDKHQALATSVYLATTRSLLATKEGGTFDPASDGTGGAGKGAFLEVKAEVDGVALTTADVGKRILVKNEGDSPERNGIYVVVSVDPTCGKMNLARAADFDDAAEMLYGTSVAVTGGTFAGKRFFMASKDVDTVNGEETDPVHWLADVDNADVSLLAGAEGLDISNAIDVNDTNGAGATTIGGTFTTGSSIFSGDITLQHIAGVDNIREVTLTSASNDAGTGGAKGTVFTGVISEAQAGDELSIRVDGGGTSTLTNPNNSYTGKTTVAGNSTLALHGDGTIATSPWLEVEAGSVFDTSQVTGGNYTLPNTTVSGSGSVATGAGKLVIGTDGGTGTLRPGMSTDGTNVATAGNQIGTLSVTGNMEFAGDATGVNRLVLQLGATNGADHNDAANIGAQLGAGTFDAWLETQANTYDTFTGGNHDRVVITGTLELHAGGHIVLTNNGGTDYAPQFGDIFNLLDWATLVQNDFNFGPDRSTGGLQGDLDLPTLSGGLAFDTSIFDSHGILVVVPEPGRALLLLVGLACLLARRRRR